MNILNKWSITFILLFVPFSLHANEITPGQLIPQSVETDWSAINNSGAVILAGFDGQTLTIKTDSHPLKKWKTHTFTNEIKLTEYEFASYDHEQIIATGQNWLVSWVSKYTSTDTSTTCYNNIYLLDQTGQFISSVTVKAQSDTCDLDNLNFHVIPLSESNDDVALIWMKQGELVVDLWQGADGLIGTSLSLTDIAQPNVHNIESGADEEANRKRNYDYIVYDKQLFIFSALEQQSNVTAITFSTQGPHVDAIKRISDRRTKIIDLTMDAQGNMYLLYYRPIAAKIDRRVLSKDWELGMQETVFKVHESLDWLVDWFLVEYNDFGQGQYLVAWRNLDTKNGIELRYNYWNPGQGWFGDVRVAHTDIGKKQNVTTTANPIRKYSDGRLIFPFYEETGNNTYQYRLLRYEPADHQWYKDTLPSGYMMRDALLMDDRLSVELFNTNNLIYFVPWNFVGEPDVTRNPHLPEQYGLSSISRTGNYYLIISSRFDFEESESYYYAYSLTANELFNSQ